MERREICQNCLQPNSFGTTVCTRCGEPIAVKRSRNNKATSASSDVNVLFNPSIELPSEWDTSQESINLSEELLAKLKKRCMQQREFDKQALVDGICYNCGRVLWSTSLISPPNGMDADSAPASAYLQAVRNCNINFVASNETSSDEKWFCCSY